MSSSLSKITEMHFCLTKRLFKKILKISILDNDVEHSEFW